MVHLIWGDDSSTAPENAGVLGTCRIALLQSARRIAAGALEKDVPSS